MTQFADKFLGGFADSLKPKHKQFIIQKTRDAEWGQTYEVCGLDEHGHLQTPDGDLYNRLVTVSRDNGKRYGEPGPFVTLNWSGCGERTVAYTRVFSAAVTLAVNLAEHVSMDAVGAPNASLNLAILLGTYAPASVSKEAPTT